ncbi:hypothetical protein CONLIGDRAFT_162702 [Coniochaeta ligniaria NRRL 30616]|uniref:Azaphilone pigments biosynthesis cluster protein L N-terminal domain-containing protein n=1 Tax=Coniochaeta ligniaria NRRL 30616 TaxID=1408157 RepID=A0A1J7JUP6_9PEZI|nr:hypothetical protein CONLIGDRAFT_162702 [Coniochaeta ligniaria NRRL 30616]
MADPFSIIGLVGTSLNGLIKTKEWIEGIRRAPQSIKALSGDLGVIERLLRELGSLLKSADDETQDSLSRLARDAVNNCEDISLQINKILRPFVSSKGGNITTWKRFSFNFRGSDVLYLQREMAACKQTLNMAIGCANLLAAQKLSRGLKRVQHHLGIATSSVADIDIATRQYERTGQWISHSEDVMCSAKRKWFGLRVIRQALLFARVGYTEHGDKVIVNTESRTEILVLNQLSLAQRVLLAAHYYGLLYFPPLQPFLVWNALPRVLNSEPNRTPALGPCAPGHK